MNTNSESGFSLSFKLIFSAILIVVVTAVFPNATRAEQSNVGKAENAFFRGSHLLSRDNIVEALPALEEAVKLDPNTRKYSKTLAVAYNNYGIKLAREGRPLDGLRAIEKAVSIEPEDTEIRGNFVSAVLQAVAGHSDKLKIEDKMYFVQKVMESDPGNVSAKKAMAALLNNQGIGVPKGVVTSSEIEALKTAFEMDPNNQKIRKNLGVAYYNTALQKGKENAFEEQIELLRTAETYVSNDPQIHESLGRALSNLAVIRGKEGKTDEQIVILKEAMEILPGDSVVKKNLAAAYNNLAINSTDMKMSDRISHLENALKLDPRNQTTVSNLSGMMVKQAVEDFRSGSSSKATALLEKAIKIDPSNKSAQSNLAIVYHNEAIKKGEDGKTEEEIQLLNKALSLASGNKTIKSDLALAYNDQAVTLGKKGDHKQELSLLLKASKLDGENQIIRENLAKAKQRDTSREKKTETGSGSRKKQDG